ncbi:MAG: patatin-like phospholipase family protein [Balneolaceae bacterium]
MGAAEVLMGEPHPSTIIAVRDSVLACLQTPDFETLWQQYPGFSRKMARLMVEHKKQKNQNGQNQKPATICMVPISDGFDITNIAASLTDEIRRYGTVALQMRATVESEFGSGAANARPTEDHYHRLSVWLDEIERNHDFTVLLADDGETEWTRRCIRHADEVLFMARMDAPMRIHPIEKRLCMGEQAITAARQSLVLLHPDWKQHPFGTGAWIDRRPVDAHYHIRPERRSDIARLSRILTGNATGLVFSGGGAKGPAHLGVFKALEEYGIEVDFVGGTSIGSMSAAYVSFDRPAGEVIGYARKTFLKNPTGDYNLLPIMSLFKGKRLKQIIDEAVVEATGVEADILDSWRTLFCVASSFTQAREVVITRGRLGHALRASLSIPVAFPPIPHKGELLVDGGIFNNFPTDIMTNMGVRRLIGVDLSAQSTSPFSYEEIPGTRDLLKTILPGKKRTNANIPSIGTLLMGITTLYSESRQKQAKSLVNIYINPDLSGIGLLEWTAFDKVVELGYKVVELGYKEAKKVLSNMEI